MEPTLSSWKGAKCALPCWELVSHFGLLLQPKGRPTKTAKIPEGSPDRQPIQANRQVFYSVGFSEVLQNKKTSHPKEEGVLVGFLPFIWGTGSWVPEALKPKDRPGACFGLCFGGQLVSL